MLPHTTFLVLAAAMPAAGQGVTIGVRAGPTGADLTELDQSEGRAGFAAGAHARFGLGASLFLQPELLYVSRRVEGVSTGTAIALDNDFADLGLLLGFRLLPGGVSPFAYAGPVVSFETRCRIQAEPDVSVTDCPDFGLDTKETQTFLALGGGVDLSLGLLILTGDVRYWAGLSDAAEDDVGSWRSWAFLLGLAFGLGG